MRASNGWFLWLGFEVGGCVRGKWRTGGGVGGGEMDSDNHGGFFEKLGHMILGQERCGCS
jgi:hypothetical protein